MYVSAVYYVDISWRSAPRGRQTSEGWVKSAVFLYLSLIVSKTVADTAKVTIND